MLNCQEFFSSLLEQFPAKLNHLTGNCSSLRL